MNIIFSESTGVADSVFGKSQMPIQMFIESQGEEMEKNSMLKEIFNMGTSENFGDSFTGMTGMSGFEPVGENGAYPMDSMQQGYTQMMTYETWKDSFALSQEAIEDGKVMDLAKQPANFMQSYKRTREKFGAAWLANAIAGDKTMMFKKKQFKLTAADQQGFFSKTHPAAADTKLTQSNMFSDEFSLAALGKMESKMHLFRGDSGEILEVAPTTIIIPEIPDLKDEVYKVIASDKDPTSSSNAFNNQFGRWNLIVWPYLNEFLQVSKGAKPWILMDSAYNQTFRSLVWNDRIQLAVRSTIDEDTDANVWRGRSRFNACGTDWRAFAVGGISGGTSLG